MSSWSLVKAEGDNSGTFLNRQLSNITLDINTQIVLHAYCTPQGRIYNNLFLWKEDTAYHMLMPSALCIPFVDRISKFILRDRVRLTRCPEYQIMYCHQAHSYALKTVQQPDAHTRLLPLWKNGYIRISSTACIQEVHQESDFQKTLIEEAWPLIEVPCLQDRFIPQVLCFDQIGGISFDKGCYPGQEIIARTHYRGAVKKHAVSLISDTIAPLHAGDPVYADGQEIGIILRAVCSSDKQWVQAVLPDQLAGERIVLDINHTSYQCHRLPCPYHD